MGFLLRFLERFAVLVCFTVQLKMLSVRSHVKARSANTYLPSTSVYQSPNNNSDYVNDDDDRFVASEEENTQRLSPFVNLSKPAGQDSSTKLLELLENKDLSEIWKYIAKDDNRKTIKSLPVCHIVVKNEEMQRKKPFWTCHILCYLLKRIGMQIWCSCCPKFKWFETCEAQRMDNDSRRWLEILSNPLYIGVEWLWRYHHSASISEKPKQDQQSQSQEMMECEDEDVIKAALHNAYILQELAKYEHHYSRKEYKQLALRCEQFAADLIRECDSADESCGAVAGAVDNELHEIMDIEGKGPLLTRSCSDENHLGIWKPVHYEQSLSLLKYAADKGRKRFVSSPKCQSVLNKIIYYSPSWQDKDTFIKLCWFLIYAILAILSFPVYFTFHCTYLARKRANCKCGFCDKDGGDDDGSEMHRGNSKCCYQFMDLVKKLFEHPYSKFVSHTTLYFSFLWLLFMVSFETEYGAMEMGMSALDVAILVYVIGLCLEQTVEMFRQGAFIYWSKWWNVVDTVTSLGFLLSYIVWLSAYFHYGKSWKPRKWPFITADVCFSSATILAYFHLTHAFQVSSVLGPLQLSLYKMLRDVLKFFLIFLLLFIAFTNGVAKVYTYYVASQIHLRRQNDTQFEPAHPLSMHPKAFIDLFWLLFSTGEEHKITVPDPDFYLTEWFGRIFLILYMICTVIVALSMLISMMSNSFDRIMGSGRPDREWKFSRARMWLEWIDKGNTLPPPLNICLVLFAVLCPCLACRCKEKMKSRKNPNRMQIMKALVERYLKKRGKNIKQFLRRLNENQESAHEESSGPNGVTDETIHEESPGPRGETDETTHEECPGPRGETDKNKQLPLQALSSIEETLISLKESMDERMAELRNVMADLERKIERMAAGKDHVNKGFEME